MIYYVEDDAAIRELVLYTLRNSGFEADGFESGQPMKAALNAGQLPELILLDIMLPGEDGMTLLRELREDAKTRTVPVIMVTAKGSEIDKVTGLDLGADDYLAKPFGMMELVSRVKAVLRRSHTSDRPAALSYGDVRINLDSRVVTAAGEVVELTYKEFELLSLLMRHAGNVVSRDVILEHIWGYDASDVTRTVDVHIRSIRKKLGDNCTMIQTVKGIGYRIGGGVQ